MKEVQYTTTEFPENVIPAGKEYILWLASWYPSKTEPFNGDFIQRHAIAVSGYRFILVLHTIHDPAAVSEVYYSVSVKQNLAEIIIYFRDTMPSGGIINKLQYNFAFFRHTKHFITELFSRSSLPLFVHVHVPMKMGKLALWIKNKWKLPFMVSEHSASYLKEAPDNYFSRSIYYRNNIKRIFNDALAVTNVSITVGKILQQTFSIRQFFIVRNVVDESLFYFKNKGIGRFRFIHVSTMTYQKNFEGLIRAFEIFSSRRNDVELVLAGPISIEGKKRVNESSAQSKIIFTGEVPYKEIASLMQESDGFVLFSRYENFPCVIIEALCCGLPVITSSAGGAGEGIDADNGIVVPSENEPALIDAMNELIKGYSRYNRNDIANRASALYSYPTVGKEFEKLYRFLGLVKL
jgi:glycosyltransferase involved in cell wall biosynthesis